MKPYCMAKGIRIAIENMICTPAKYQFEKLDKLFERYDLDYMGFCCDTGHAALVCPDDTLAFINRYKSRLIAMHLDDNHLIDWSLSKDHDGAIQKSDLHLIPFEGACDWDGICKAIAESPYELPLTLEVTFPHSTIEEEAAGIEKAKNAGEKLTDMVLKYR